MKHILFILVFVIPGFISKAQIITPTGNKGQVLEYLGGVFGDSLLIAPVQDNFNYAGTSLRKKGRLRVGVTDNFLYYHNGTTDVKLLSAETDPVFLASPAFGIGSTDISHWNTAYSWGNHATVGYELQSNKATSFVTQNNTLFPSVLAVETEILSKGYITGNQTITLSGDVSGSGTTAITTTIGAGKVTNTMVATGIDAAKLNTGVVSNTEYNYLDGVTSAIQGQINSKEPTITHGTSSQYFKGDFSLGTFSTDVRSQFSATTATGMQYNSSTGVLSLSAIPNSSLSNSTISGIALGSNLNSLTISTGLTGTASTYNGSAAVTLTNDVVTGKSGGQTWSGGTGASETLTIQSTTNATKGNIIFGTTSKMWFNGNNGRLIIGSASDGGQALQVTGTVNFNGGGTFTNGDFAIGSTGFLNYNSVSGISSGDIAYLDGNNRVKFLNSTIHLDLTNSRLGIFTASPSVHLEFTGTSSASTGRGVIAQMTDTRTSGNYLFAGFRAVSQGQSIQVGTMATNTFAPYNSVDGGYIQNGASGSPTFITTNNAGTEAKHTTFFANGNGGVGIANTDGGFKWDVNGTGRYQNQLTLATGTTAIAPLLMPAGSLLSSIGTNGTFEFDGTHVYITIGGVRKQLDN